MKISILGVFFCLVVVAFGDYCPPEEDVFPCSCEDEVEEVILMCSGKESRMSDVQRALKSLKEAKNINLVLDEIEDSEPLKGDFLAGYDIKTMEISHCSLKSEGDKPPFTGLENTLEELSILSSLDHEASSTEFRLNHLTSLRELDISYNHIHQLDDKSFPSSLKGLSLSNNGIEKLGDHVFANLVNLKTLSLDGNRFGPVKRSWLPSPAEKLRLIELDNNDLTSIPQDLFDKMPALREISLRTNNIQKMEQDTWENIWPQLRRINLQGNPLFCDSHMDWMLQRELSAFLFGTCVGPKDRDGKTLQELVQNH